MERTEIINKVQELKGEVLNEIHKVLSQYDFYEFIEPFLIHYIEGEVATTEKCVGIRVCEGDIIIYTQSEGYEGEEMDSTDGELVYNFGITSLADILHNLKKELREKKMKILRKLIKDAGGELIFDGSFTFTGVDEIANSKIVYIDDKLIGIILMEDGTLCFIDMWEGDLYNNDEDYIDFDELDRIIEYIKSEIKQTYHIQVVASRFVDVEAVNKDEAVKLAKEEIKKHPLNEEDIDDCLIK